MGMQISYFLSGEQRLNPPELYTSDEVKDFKDRNDLANEKALDEFLERRREDMALRVIEVATPEYFCNRLEAYAKENPGDSFFIRIRGDEIKALRNLIDEYKALKNTRKEHL